LKLKGAAHFAPRRLETMENNHEETKMLRIADRGSRIASGATDSLFAPRSSIIFFGLLQTLSLKACDTTGGKYGGDYSSQRRAQ
jgi:hypothetical protein